MAAEVCRKLECKFTWIYMVLFGLGIKRELFAAENFRSTQGSILLFDTNQISKLLRHAAVVSRAPLGILSHRTCIRAGTSLAG
jgi:hypothetical protein